MEIINENGYSDYKRKVMSDNYGSTDNGEQAQEWFEQYTLGITL
jgi:hypothetical protein